MGGLGAEFIENLTKQASTSYNFGRTYASHNHARWMLDIHSNHRCSFEDLKTYAAVALHLSFIRTCMVIVLVRRVKQVVTDLSVKNRIEVTESVT